MIIHNEALADAFRVIWVLMGLIALGALAAAYLMWNRRSMDRYALRMERDMAEHPEFYQRKSDS